MATLDSLPTEVLFNICSFLKPKEVSKLSKVNKKLYAIHFEVLKSIGHLKLYMYPSAEAANIILRYKNITTLETYGLTWREIFRLEKGRKKFAAKLATSCPKIDTFSVFGVPGVELVRLYIICRREMFKQGDNNSRATEGIKNLSVGPGNLNRQQNFFGISKGLRDIVKVSTDFNCLTILTMRGMFDQNDSPQFVDYWNTIGNSIKGFEVVQFNILWLLYDFTGAFSLTILPSLHNLDSFTMSSVSQNELDVITTNNSGLKSFTCRSLGRFAFDYIQRLTQLKYLKIGFNRNLTDDEISQYNTDGVFEAVSDSLLTIDLTLNKWINSFMAIGEKCRNLRSIKLMVREIADYHLEEFRGSFGPDVEVSIQKY